MLGAHARAAEYNAAKKAQARQASREAEEQKVPPPTAPISLGAFTRPVTSRNKGTKAYIPLVLESTPEADREASEDDLAETPTKKPCTPASRQSSARIAQLRHSILNAPPPTAPRSMVPREYAESMVQPAPLFAPRPQSMPAFHDTPPHMVPPYFYPPNYPYSQLPPPPQMLPPPPQYAWPPQFPFPDHPFPFPPPPLQPQRQPSIFDSPAPAQRRAVPPPSELHLRRAIQIRQPAEEPLRQRQETPQKPTETPPRLRPQALPQGTPQEHSQEDPQEPPQQPQHPTTPESRVRRFVFGPDDLSPSKQEVKNSARAKLHRDQEEAERQLTAGSERGVQPVVSNPIRMREPTLTDSSLRIEREHLAAITPTPRPAMKDQFESHQRMAPTYQGSLPNPLRQYNEASDKIVEPLTAVPWMRSGNIPDNVLMADNDAPYDRAAKMQKFVAVQQELNKQGKTVLHNPERKHTTSVVSQVPSIPIDSTGGPGPAMPEEQARHLPRVTQQANYASLQPPPGLEKPDRPFVPPTNEEDLQAKADEELRQDFGVGNDDWFDLKPPTRADRKKMQSAMKHIRQKNANQESRRVGDNGRWFTESRAEKLIEEDHRPFPHARQRISNMADDYSSRVHAAAGHPKPTQGEVDFHAGMVRGAGHILSNLSESLIDSKDKRDYFSRTKAVPESAIDRVALASGVTNISLFEENTIQNQKAPSRFLRDPRYAHLSTASPQSKSEDSGLYTTKYGWGS